LAVVRDDREFVDDDDLDERREVDFEGRDFRDLDLEYFWCVKRGLEREDETVDGVVGVADGSEYAVYEYVVLR